ncbi:hypothetical protein, partial [Acinetobacter baumannii]|uniref:hypothetical protein n=1 Tax=Acinetobacter baumannii TaxID=470 RepID=UPI001C08049B
GGEGHVLDQPVWGGGALSGAQDQAPGWCSISRRVAGRCRPLERSLSQLRLQGRRKYTVLAMATVRSPP